MRVGVHTGLVVAGEMGSGENLETLAIVGETPNIAARLQEAAEPNSVVVSDVTQRLIQDFFDCQSMGAHGLRGIAEPMELFQVLSDRDSRSRRRSGIRYAGRPCGPRARTWPAVRPVGAR